MSGILRLDKIGKGNTLRQGDLTVLKYKLSDSEGAELDIAGKPAVVRLMKSNFTFIAYEKEGLTITPDDTISFNINKVLPGGIYYLEVVVDDKYIFPSRSDEGKFNIDKSSLGAELTIIENAGIDAVVRKAIDLINSDPSLILDEERLVNEIIANTGIGSIDEYYEEFGNVLNEFNILKPEAEKAIQESHEALVKSESVQTQFNQVIIEGDSSVEAAQARVNADGVAKATLKQRLDDEHNEVTAQLVEKGEEIEAGRYVDSQHIASLAHILNDTQSTDFADPLIQVTNTTNDEKKHVAFPAAAIDGNNVLVMYRRGATHISTGGTQDNGAFVQKKSVDGGKTWSAETIVYPSTVGFDARDPNIYQLSATELILVFPLVGLNTNGTIKSVENEVWKTIDFGASWSKIGVLPKKGDGNWYHIIRGSITKSTTGRILIPVWSANLSTNVTAIPYIVYSDDNGLTWNVGKDISNAQATETAIEFDNHNRLWAVMRNDLTTGVQRTRNMLIAFSDDSGETWSNAVEMPIKGHAPHLLKLSKGLLLTYRNTDKYIIDSTQDRYSTNFVVLNNGAITSTINSVFDSQSPDQAYPWAVKNGSKIFLFFYVYSHPTMGVIYLKTLDIAKVERLSLTQKADLTYINAANAKTSIAKHKTFIGDNSVKGNGTTFASKIIGLGETVKGIKSVKVTVLNDTTANFITTVSGITTTGFTVNVKNIAGNFSTAVQVYWEVIAELN